MARNKHNDPSVGRSADSRSIDRDKISVDFTTFPCLIDLKPDGRSLTSVHCIDESQPKKIRIKLKSQACRHPTSRTASYTHRLSHLSPELLLSSARIPRHGRKKMQKNEVSWFVRTMKLTRFERMTLWMSSTGITRATTAP
jgi:hypothetical protein